MIRYNKKLVKKALKESDLLTNMLNKRKESGLPTSYDIDSIIPSLPFFIQITGSGKLFDKMMSLPNNLVTLPQEVVDKYKETNPLIYSQALVAQSPFLVVLTCLSLSPYVIDILKSFKSK